MKLQDQLNNCNLLCTEANAICQSMGQKKNIESESMLKLEAQIYKV